MRRIAEGAVVVLEHQVDTHVGRLARRHGLVPIATANPRNAVRCVVAGRFGLVVVDVGPRWERAVEFIHLMAWFGWADRLVAVARRHSRLLEGAVLRAGARFYLPNVSSPLASAVLAAARRSRCPAMTGDDTKG